MPKDNNITNSQEQNVVTNQDADAQTNNLPGDKVYQDPGGKKTPLTKPKTLNSQKRASNKANTDKSV